MDLIDRFQPDHDQADPFRHQLSLLNRFSNPDKHRQLVNLVRFFAEDYAPQLDVRFDGVCVDRWQSLRFELSLDDEAKLASFRFAEPFPPEVSVNADPRIQTMLATAPFPPRYKPGAMISLEVLQHIELDPVLLTP